MIQLFCRLFNLYPGEEKQAFMFTVLAFLWALAVTSHLKFADALFLLHVGSDQLPIAYGVSAGVMIILASFLLYAFHNIDTNKVFLGVIAVAAANYASIFFCYIYEWGVESKFLWYYLRITGTISLAIFTTCYWTFVDQYYSLQDAKRLFSLFTSAIFLGLATTGTIMHLGLVEFEQVLLVLIGIMAFVTFLVNYIHSIVKPVHDENSLQESASQGDLSVIDVIKMISNSPFTMLLMVSNFMIYITLVVTEYNYLASFESHFPSDVPLGANEGEQAALTLFLGKCLIGVSISNLLIGLFLYSRLVRRFGLRSVLPITGVILLLNYSGWIMVDSISFAVVALFVVEGTIYVIDDSNFNLLLNGVPPRLKHRVRIVIESFFEPTGMLLSSGLISLVMFNPLWLGWLLAAIVITLAIILGYQYGRAIYRNLADNAIHFHKSLIDWINPRDQALLLQTLKNGDDTTKLIAAEGLMVFEDQNLLKALMSAADMESVNYKINLLRLLHHSPISDHSIVIETLSRWYEVDESPELLSFIQFYLASLGFVHPEKALQDVDSADLLRKGAAVLALKKTWAHLSPTQVVQNRALAVQLQEEMLTSQDEEQVVLGLTLIGIEKSPHDAELLIPFLKDWRAKVAVKAMEAFASVADVHYFKHFRMLSNLLYKGTSSEFRQSTIKALCNVGGTSAVKEIVSASHLFRPQERRAAEKEITTMGLRTVPILLGLMKDVQLHDRSRIFAVRLLSRLALPQLRANLADIVHREIERAYFYDHHSALLKNTTSKVDLTILIETLETSYRLVVDFIIHLLGEAGEIEDSELLARSLQSRNPKVRSQVLETLEKTCPREIFFLLYPLVADAPESEKQRASHNMKELRISFEELLEKLCNSSSNLERMVGAMYKQQLDLPSWRESLRKQMQSKEEIFHHFAYELLEA